MGEVYRARDEKLNRGGSQARWRRDGKELFYLGGDRKITAVDVNTEAAAFAHGTPKALFETRISKGEDRPPATSMWLPRMANVFSSTR